MSSKLEKSAWSCATSREATAKSLAVSRGSTEMLGIVCFLTGSRVIRMPTGIDPSVFDVNQSIKNCSQGHVVADFNGCFDKRLKATVNLESTGALWKIHKVLNQGSEQSRVVVWCCMNRYEIRWDPLKFPWNPAQGLVLLQQQVFFVLE